MTICAQDLKLFLWKCYFENSVWVSYSYSFDYDRLQKMQNFLLENV